MAGDLNARKVSCKSIKAPLLVFLPKTHITLPLVIIIIIKFAYNARSDWLEQSALSESRKQVYDITSWVSKFLLPKLTNLSEIEHSL